MSAWRNRWQRLAPREQRILIAAAGVLGLLLGFLGVWEPLTQSRDAARVRLEAARSDLAWMRAAAPIVRERRASSPPASADGRSLLARVDGTAREAGLGTALLRVEPLSGGQVRVTFERAGFDPMVAWIERLAEQYGTRASELSVQRADGVGLVDARLTLEESPR